MMLNILMTFAQYEREVITERIKDKVSAAKKRGMHCGGVMMETFTKKKDKRYRYFACEKDMKRINSICPLKRVPAAELENLLLREIGSMLAKPEVIAGVMHQAAELDEHGKHLKLPTV